MGEILIWKPIFCRKSLKQSETFKKSLEQDMKSDIENNRYKKKVKVGREIGYAESSREIKSPDFFSQSQFRNEITPLSCIVFWSFQTNFCKTFVELFIWIPPYTKSAAFNGIFCLLSSVKQLLGFSLSWGWTSWSILKHKNVPICLEDVKLSFLNSN